MADFDINVTANDNKALTSFVGATVKAYGKMSVQLHTAACMALYHALQYREASALNLLYNGLRRADQANLRQWIGKLTNVPGNSERNPFENARTLIGFTRDRGLFVRKGLKSEDAWVLHSDVEDQPGLMQMRPFFERKNENERAAIDLNKLLDMLANAAKRVSDRADKEDIELPDTVNTLIGEIEKVTKAAHVATNDNDADDKGENRRANIAA